MDDRQFDAWVRSMAAGANRRQVLRGLLGGGLALVAARSGTATVAAAGKVTVCHWNGAYYEQILVSNSSIPAHTAHPGDIVAPDLTSDATCGDCNTACVSPATCGGGGQPGVCACAPSCPAGYCGGDGCGGWCSCGSGETCCESIALCIPANGCCDDSECEAPACHSVTCTSGHQCEPVFDCGLGDGDACCLPDGVCLADGSCCAPLSPCVAGACGQISNNCGQMIDCGKCPAGSICTSGNTCCVQASCAGRCGSIPDGCAGNLDCGECPSGQTCLADQTCCERATCAPGVCGTIEDGCDSTVTCDPCPDGQTCLADHTCCERATCAPGMCGTIDDECGSTVTCGNCPSGQTCLANHTCCQPRTCDGQCGSIPDGCGGRVNCGGCPAADYNLCFCMTSWVDGRNVCTQSYIGYYADCGACKTDADCDVEGFERYDKVCVNRSNDGACGAEGGACALICTY